MEATDARHMVRIPAAASPYRTDASTESVVIRATYERTSTGECLRKELVVVPADATDAQIRSAMKRALRLPSGHWETISDPDDPFVEAHHKASDTGLIYYIDHSLMVE